MIMRSVALALTLLTVLVFAPPALADDNERARAESHYSEGLRLLQEGHAEQALAELDASAKLLPSPNTDLLRAHAFRSLRRRVDAMNVYERVVRDAGARVRAGEARFEATLAEAGRWVAFLRNELGELVLELRVGKRPFSASVDLESIQLKADPGTGIARASLWREPGTVRVRVRPADGAERTRAVAITAGTSQLVSLDLTPAQPIAPTAPPSAESHGPPLTSYVAWGIGAVGLGVFAVAGSMARTKMNELDQCKPSCTETQTDEAETRATIANVGLVVGLVGAVSGGAIWLASEATRPEAGYRAGVAISARSAGLSLGGSF